MNQNDKQLNSLRIAVTGESLRSVFGLRIKEQDRIIGRYEAAIAAAKAELVEVEKLGEQAVARLTGRQVPVPQGLSGYGMPTDLTSYKRSIDATESKLAALQHNRATLVWLRDQFVPTEKYELSTFDLNFLGFNERDVSTFHSPHDLLGGCC